MSIVAVASCGFPRPSHLVDDAGPDAANVDPDAAQSTTYQLLALAPATAATGDTITLEGTFGDAATVHFPGNVSQPATVLGGHRATVVVPAMATAGDLTVETGGATVGPLKFRRASFALGLQPFQQAYEQVDVARRMPNLATPRSGHSTVIIGSSLYVVGGVGATGYLSSIERATVNGDGSLGEFAIVAGATLTTARAGHVLLIVGTTVYVVGGDSAGGALSTVERATINEDGTLGPFSVATVSLATARKYSAGCVVGNALYMVGGADSGALETVERAEISANGSLGPFTIVSNAKLATARSGHTCTAIGSNIYVAGGTTTSGATGNIERAAIAGGGEISTFESVSGVTLKTARSGHTASVMGAALYVLGGLGGLEDLVTIETATIAPNGTIGPFATVSGVELTTPRDGHTASIIQNHMYVIGGSNGAPLGGVERGWINASGKIGTFTSTANSALTTDIICATTAIVGNYVYVIGGRAGNDSQHPLDSIERATINPDGTLGPFSLMPNIHLATSRSCHTSAIVGQYLYVVGGNGNGSGTNNAPLASIERATIDTHGELGAFSTIPGVALTTARSSHMSVVVGNIIYVIGGTSAVNELTGVEKAVFAPDGSLGNFSNDQFSALTLGRSYGSSAAVHDTIYVFGGYNNGQIQASVEQTVITSGEDIGAFGISPQTSMTGPRAGMSAAVMGTALYLLGGFDPKESTTAESAAIGGLTLRGPFAIAPQVSLAATRSSFVSLVIGNFLYNVGGASSGAIEQAPLL